LNSSDYAAFARESSLLPDNLKVSFSGLCLAGRAAGESVTRERCSSIRFRFNEVERNLVDLLTIHGWSSGSEVSRMSFFNIRTGRFDRHSCSPTVVVCDGIEGILETLERREFQRADVIGVLNRTVERSRLELLGNRMSELRQWYDTDEVFASNPPPPGIRVSALRRRRS
jgi:hypothetical protein